MLPVYDTTMTLSIDMPCQMMRRFHGLSMSGLMKEIVYKEESFNQHSAIAVGVLKHTLRMARLMEHTSERPDMEKGHKNIRLKEDQIDQLSQLPENGMGYQVVRLLLKDGTTLDNRLVFNSEYLQVGLDEALDADQIESIALSRI